MGGIYLIQEQGQLVEMAETSYQSEDLLQKLLADYPSLLAGEQIDSAAPRRWLLVSREILIPDSEDSGGRWALDHLFLDQDAIPTLVEVKRANDSRIRREVVGQMLDYAANAVNYWSIDKIRTQFEAKRDSEQLLIELIGEDNANIEKFWQQVTTNLQAGKIRLIFVADKIPVELQRIVEFLNQQMNPAQVLAVEIKQYVGQNLKTLVPRVIGQVTVKKTLINSTEKKQWNKLSFMKIIEEKYGIDVAKVAGRIFDWSIEQSMQIEWGKGQICVCFIPQFQHQENIYNFFKVWEDTNVQILPNKLPLKFEKKTELRQRLQDVIGQSKTLDLSEWNIHLSVLKDELVLNQFLDVLAWAIDEIKLL
ncbi:hypothetical protein H6G04_24540 [Calothrix membranacea FACHB-236]|nr:hypothetical protein [Calothrix membranacea FACHB-236]